MFIYFSSHGSSLISLPFAPSFVAYCFCSCDVCSDLVYTDVCSDLVFGCTNQQPLQRGGAVPNSVWVGSKWLLTFPRVPVTLGTLLHFFALLPPERPQKGSTQLP